MITLPPITALRDFDEEAWTQLLAELFPKALAAATRASFQPIKTLRHAHSEPLNLASKFGD